MTVPYAAGPLAILVSSVRDIVAQLTPTYFFKRGPIDYTSWPYERYGRTISLQVDESTMFKEMNEAVLTFELSWRIAGAPGGDEVTSIDDGVQDEMRGHLYYIINKMRTWTLDSGDPLVIGATFTQPVTEFHDTSLGMQGISYTFTISY